MASTKTQIQAEEDTSTDEVTVEVTPLADVKAALSSRYEILESLGKGEVCTVYRAIDRKSTVEVALEILPPHLSQNEDYVKRFHKEASIASRLNNRNISKVYDEGVHNGVHFVTVEYLDGLDLHTMVMWKGRLDTKEAVKIISPCVEALAYAHEKGLVHRDVRSSNIIITDVGRPVLTDFWLDHSFRGIKLAGALEYMAPEQVQGKEVTKSTNIYAFGIILYEALTGKVPFSGSNPFDIVGKIISGSPVFPRKIASTIPDWMEEIVLRCLAKEPKERFSSSAELAAALLRSKAPSLTAAQPNPVQQKPSPAHPPPKPKAKTPKIRKIEPIAEPKAPPPPLPKPPLEKKEKEESKKKEVEARIEIAEKVETPRPVEKKVDKPVSVQEVKTEPKPAHKTKRLLKVGLPLAAAAAALIIVISNPGLLHHGTQDQSKTSDEGIATEKTIAQPTQQANESKPEEQEPSPNKANEEPTTEVSKGSGTATKGESPAPIQPVTSAASAKEKVEVKEKAAAPAPSNAKAVPVKAAPPEKVVPKIPIIDIQWVYVDSGSFQMGSNSYAATKPIHTVKVGSFYMSATEITFEQYDKFCDATHSKKPDDNGWGRGKMPVINVSWNDAIAFCQWVSDQTGSTVRLPTEAEYEYAARGGNKAQDYTYSGNNTADLVAWYSDNSGGRPQVVATKLPNELGLYDMSGNVWEWCQDWYHQSYDGAPDNGKKWSVMDKYNPYRVLRGGSAMGAKYCTQVAFRFWLAPFYRDKSIGFRVVKQAK